MTPGEQLLARLGLDTTGFKAELRSAHSAFSSTMSKMAAITGVAIGVQGLKESAREITEYGARVYDLGQRFGVSTDIIQKFGNAAAENGSSMEGLTRGFNKLEIAQARALEGNGAAVKAFERLGISIDDLKNLSPDQLFLKIGKSGLDAADMVTIFGKSALELRPLLSGLADGSIELGEAMDKGVIAKLKQSDQQFNSFWRTLRIAGGNTLDFLIDKVNHLTRALAATASALGKLDPTGWLTRGGNAIQAALDWQAKDLAKKEAIAAGKKPQVSEIEAVKSPRELAAEKKERERDQLSLKDLAEKGPGYAKRTGATYTQSSGTMEMIYAAQQARLVESLEAQAKQVRLTGISPTGESSAQLLSRADAIRQTLPIKESEKEVGIFRQAFKESLSETNEKLEEIRSELE